MINSKLPIIFWVSLFVSTFASPIWQSILVKPIKEIQLPSSTKDTDVFELDQLKYGNTNIEKYTLIPILDKEEQIEQHNIIKTNKIKDVTYLLRRNISAFEISNYVFWTGDELGVALGVENLIKEGFMTRETAIKFLKDIRVGLEYLKNSYSENKFGDSMKENTKTTARTSFTSTKIPDSINQKKNIFDKLNDQIKDETFIDSENEVNVKLNLTDFLYAEYALEEVIYQLAKVMFAQSLNKRSEQAQDALQRLIEFLEVEGNNGRISKQLQKKILDVLLTALSDTLIENPELVEKAKFELGNSIYDIQKNILKNHV